MRDALFQGPRSGGIGLLRDLTDLWLATSEVHCCYECLVQAAKALRDKDLIETCYPSSEMPIVSLPGCGRGLIRRRRKRSLSREGRLKGHPEHT